MKSSIRKQDREAAKESATESSQTAALDVREESSE